jgi:hypothetical protein
MTFDELAKRDELAQEYIVYAHSVRGELVHKVAEMEQRMDRYICEHFCATPEKTKEFAEVIISTKHIAFSSKADIIKHLLKTNNHATTKEANKIHDILLKKIARDRNILAHCSLEVTHETVNDFHKNKNITFLRFLNVTSREVYTQAKIKNLITSTEILRMYFYFIKTHKLKLFR